MKCSCGCKMVYLAESWTDSNGNRYISYRCPNCGNIIKVKE